MSLKLMLLAVVHRVAKVQEVKPDSVWLNAQIREECTPCVKEPAVKVTLNCRSADGARVKFWTEDCTHGGW